MNKLECAIWLGLSSLRKMVIDKEEGGFSPSDQFRQPEHLIAEVYRCVVALYLRLPAYEHVKCFTNNFKQMPRWLLILSRCSKDILLQFVVPIPVPW